MRLGQTSIVYFVSKIIGSILGFIATIYFARILGETVLGQYALVIAVVTWLSLVGNIGFSSAVTKRISEGNHVEEYIGAGVFVMGLLFILISVATLIFQDYINAYVGIPVAETIILILFALLFKALVVASLKGVHLVHIYAVLSTVRQGLRAALQIMLVVLGGLGLSGLLYGYAAGHFAIAIIGVVILGIRPAIPSYYHIQSLFNYAKFSWLGNMRSQTFDTVDITILGLFVTQGLVGIYSIAWSLSKFLEIFGDAISNTFFPEMSRISAQEDSQAIAGLTRDSLSFAGLILIPGFTGAIVIDDLLLRIYSEAFVAGTAVLWILIAALLIYTYNNQLLNVLNAIDRPDLAFRSNTIFIITNVLLNFVLIWQFGWIGAAISTAFSAAIGLVFSYHYAHKQVPFTIPAAEIARQWIAAIVMAIVIFIIRRTAEISLPTLVEFNELFVLILVLTGALIYFSLLTLISKRVRTAILANLTR